MSKPADPRKPAPGFFAPVVNRTKCEGKQDCVRVRQKRFENPIETPRGNSSTDIGVSRLALQ